MYTLDAHTHAHTHAHTESERERERGERERERESEREREREREGERERERERDRERAPAQLAAHRQKGTVSNRRGRADKEAGAALLELALDHPCTSMAMRQFVFLFFAAEISSRPSLHK